MIYVLLPAFNEEEALPPLVAKIADAMGRMGAKYEIVAVDDGSDDATPDVLCDLARTTPIHVIRHTYNRGLGETARDGFEYVAETARPEDVVVRLDCDDTHEPMYIEAMVAKLNEGCEVVTASRYQRGGGQIGVNLYRRTISRCANLLMKSCFPLRGIREYTCGYRAYRVSFVQDALAIFGNQFIDLKGMGFTGTVEKMIKAQMMRARVGAVPFVLRYDQKQGPSKVVTNITTLGYLVLIAKFVVYWGDIGQGWKREIAARHARRYDEAGNLLLGPVRLD